MNPPLFLLRSTIFMDLPGESRIGAWATFDDCLMVEDQRKRAATVDVNVLVLFGWASTISPSA
jgi:hypothetical protein